MHDTRVELCPPSAAHLMPPSERLSKEVLANLSTAGTLPLPSMGGASRCSLLTPTQPLHFYRMPADLTWVMLVFQ